jgi:dehydrogenase/reductase SDR family member 12
LRDSIDRWQEEGVNVVVIGNGNADFAEAFRTEFQLDATLLVDPDLAAYRAAGLRRGRLEIASPKLIQNAYRAYRGGARQTGVEGDPWQLGGTFVFDRGGDLKLAFRSREAGDHVSPDEIDRSLAEDAPSIDDAGDRTDPLVEGLGKLARPIRPILDLSPLGSFDRIGYSRHALSFDRGDLDVDLHGQRCLVTGANSGIGFEAARALADLGANVVMLCRSIERGEAAAESIRKETGNRRVECVQVDLSNLSSIDRALVELRKESVDILIHNAGLLPDERIDSEDGLEITFATHLAGPHRLTQGLRHALEADGGGRVIWVSSGGMLTRRLNVDDAQWRKRPYNGVLAYAETKRAQVVLAELWADSFAGTQVVVNSMHPGWADTAAVSDSLPSFYRTTKPILRTPAEGADTIVWLAAASAAGRETGRFFFDRMPVRTHWVPWTRENEMDRKRLWALCDEARPLREVHSQANAGERRESG